LLLQPSPTIFPYTTLFRTRVGRVDRHLAGEDEMERRREARLEVEALHRRVRAAGPIGDEHRRHRSPVFVEAVVSAVLLPHDSPRDRKSTRLNSSHVKISYA